MRKIVIVTTGQPSVNPRVVKEADALHAAGHDVTVLFCFWIQWAEDADKGLLKKVQWKYQLIGGSPSKNKILYFYTRARFKLNKELNKRFGNRLLFAERSQARCFDELLKAAKSIKADWYIGHNLGALAIAVEAASHHGASAAFDFEDYHREENNNSPDDERKRIVYLEEKYLEKLRYISTSSPLITKLVQSHFPSFAKPITTLLNCFSLTQRPAFNLSNNHSLKLFWFSQMVGSNRGLETVLDALKLLNDESITLTLVGRYTDETEKNFKQKAGAFAANIHFLGVVEPQKIFEIASTMDVGLALEPCHPLNRDVCLTNKIFTYLLAGNAIILSETSAQKLFNDENSIGESFEDNNVAELSRKIMLHKNNLILNKQRVHNYQLSQNLFNWEIESKKLLEVLS